MELIEVKTLTDINEGDMLIVTGDVLVNEPLKVSKVKVNKIDGTEIIFSGKGNRYFNLGMYLKGKSWVKECKVIK